MQRRTITRQAGPRRPARKPGRPTVADAGRHLQQFISKFEPSHQRLIRAARKNLRHRLPTAFELVYDNYNFFVIGYSPTERPSDAILSLTAAANGVGLCFIHGARLPDPEGLLMGSGKQTRFIRVPSADVLRRREVESLIAAAIAAAGTPFARSGEGRVVIRSVSAKQRPRSSMRTPRPAAQASTRTRDTPHRPRTKSK